jgi:hypothetical protein
METTAFVLIDLGAIAIAPVIVVAVLAISEWRKRYAP